MAFVKIKACMTCIRGVTYQSAVRVVSRKSIFNPRYDAFIST